MLARGFHCHVKFHLANCNNRLIQGSRSTEGGKVERYSQRGHGIRRGDRGRRARGLAAAIRIKQLAIEAGKDVSVVVVEKGRKSAPTFSPAQ